MTEENETLEQQNTISQALKQHRALSAPPSSSPFSFSLGLLGTKMAAAATMVGSTVAGNNRVSSWLSGSAKSTRPTFTNNMTRFLWASLSDTCSWITRSIFRNPFAAETSIADTLQQPPQLQHPPGYSSRFKYGFLQGTFGLPYGGYLVHPPHKLQSTLILSDAVSMFSVIGTKQEITSFLKTMRTMIFTHMSARTYTSDIVVELYRTTPETSIIKKWIDFSTERQLVIRAGRTFTPSDFKPILRIQAPQGLMMCEIASILEKPIKGSTINLTRDKALNIKVMGRSRSASNLATKNSNHPDDLDFLPPYRKQSEDGLPPAYSQ
ncbi:hypothetical protein LPJ64_000657 [Coemansia asiatica]|uniref:Uncharacterized protein n=1 Tax=Coemansia asiatica TaxID=1052880 RepID=A0A9W7XRH7_9FUNG|nr:hypothetical protein LPJ64_000657 [Coemansia asiatica]